jgi:hypothetical protein
LRDLSHCSQPWTLLSGPLRALAVAPGRFETFSKFFGANRHNTKLENSNRDYPDRHQSRPTPSLREMCSHLGNGQCASLHPRRTPSLRTRSCPVGRTREEYRYEYGKAARCCGLRVESDGVSREWRQLTRYHLYRHDALEAYLLLSTPHPFPCTERCLDPIWPSRNIE